MAVAVSVALVLPQRRARPLRPTGQHLHLRLQHALGGTSQHVEHQIGIAGLSTSPISAILSSVIVVSGSGQGLAPLRAIAADDLPAGQLRLGATASALTGPLPDLIARLSARHPQIDFFVRPGSSVDLYHAVLRGDLDAGLIVRLPFAIPKPANGSPCGPSRSCCWCPRTRPSTACKPCR